MKCFGQAYLIESMIMGWYYKHKGRRCRVPMDQKLEAILSNTAYDDAFRTLVNECHELVLPLINEMFGEHYR